MNLKPRQHEQIFYEKFSMIILLTRAREKIFENHPWQVLLLENWCVSFNVAIKIYYL